MTTASRSSLLVPVLLLLACSAVKPEEKRASPSASPSKVVKQLVSQMEADSGPKETWLAYQMLQRMGHVALPSLRRLAVSTNPLLRRGAVRGLSAIGARAGAVMPVLLGLMRDADPGVRLAVVHSLGVLQGDRSAAVPGLKEMIADPSPVVRTAAVDLVIRLDAKGALPWLETGLGHRTAAVRAAALRGLFQLGRSALSLLEKITAAGQDGDERVRLEACATLGHLGPAAAAAIPLLVQILAEDRPKVRQAAARALGEVATTQAAVALALGLALRDKDTSLHDAAAVALSRMGESAAPAGRELIEALSDSSHQTRHAAATALGNLGPGAGPGTAAALGRAMGDEREEVAWAAAAALGKIGRFHPEAVRTLRAALRHPNPLVRKAAISGVTIPGTNLDRSRTLLRQMSVSDPHPQVRQRAAQAIEQR